MVNAKQLQQERIRIFHDIYDNKIPKGFPLI